MTWSYHADLQNSKLDELRFAIGDVDEDLPQMQDEELLAILATTNGNIREATTECLFHLMLKYAYQVNYTIGPEKVEAGERYKHYQLMYLQYKKKIGEYAYPISEGVITPATPFIFDIGMQDNR